MYLRKWCPYVIFAACAGLYFCPFMRLLLPETDEGTLIYGAVRVTEGQIPFRDFFEVMGPGTFYWLALFFKLLGTTWLATRVSLFVTSMVTVLSMYFLARRLQEGPDVLPAAVLLATSFGALWPAISHHNDSNMFALLSFSALALWFDKRTPFLLFIAGALAGVTTFFMQPKGMLLIASFLLLLCLFHRKDAQFLRSIAFLVMGFVGVVAGVISLYWKVGALPDLIYANVVWPLQNYGYVNDVPYGFGALRLHWDQWIAPLTADIGPTAAAGVCSFLELPFLFIAVLPLLVLLFTLRYRPVVFNTRTFPYWIVGWALWASELHRKDITHLAYGSPLLLLVFFHLCGQLRGRLGKYALQTIAISVSCLLAFNFLIALTAQAKLVTRRGAISAFRSDSVLDFLNTRVKPGDAMFAYSYRPIYYFLLAAKNPTRFSILLYRMNTDSQFYEVVRSIDEAKVRYIVWDTTLEDERVRWAFPAGWAPPKQRIVEPYLAEHYHLVATFDGVRILERGTVNLPGSVSAAGGAL